jgi:Protein of unknown function (DUF3579)
VTFVIGILVNTFSNPFQYKSFLILGKTPDGQVFRPSDWAERLCGVMHSYQPEGMIATHITYSPWVMPGQIEGIKCVHVDGAIGMVEPMAYKFLRSFAQDNQLQITEL